MKFFKKIMKESRITFEDRQTHSPQGQFPGKLLFELGNYILIKKI